MLGAVFLQQYIKTVAIMSNSISSDVSASTQIPKTRVRFPALKTISDLLLIAVHPAGSSPHSEVEFGTKLKHIVATCRTIHPENRCINPAKLDNRSLQIILNLNSQSQSKRREDRKPQLLQRISRGGKKWNCPK